MCTFFIFAGTFILFWMDVKNHESQKLRISCGKSEFSFRIFQTPLRDEIFLPVHLFPAFFHIFEVFSIFLFYIFHVTFPLFSISPGICSFPVFFNAFQNAFKIFSILFFRQFHFLISRYCKNIPLAYVPSLLFSMLTGPISPLRCCLQRIFC